MRIRVLSNPSTIALMESSWLLTPIGGITIWKASSRFFSQLQKLSGHDGWVNAISCSLSGKYFVPGSVRIIKIWRILGIRFTNGDNIKDPNLTQLATVCGATRKIRSCLRILARS